MRRSGQRDPANRARILGKSAKILGLNPALTSQQQRGPQQAVRPGAHEILERHLRFSDPHTHLNAIAN